MGSRRGERCQRKRSWQKKTKKHRLELAKQKMEGKKSPREKEKEKKGKQYMSDMPSVC